MERIKPKVWNRLTMNSTEIAAEVESSAPTLRHWVVIFPNLGKHIDINVPPHKFSILDFELDRSLVDEYFSEEDKVNQNRYYVEDEEDLYEVLKKIKMSPELFDVPWKYDCPV